MNSFIKKYNNRYDYKIKTIIINRSFILFQPVFISL